MSAALATDQLYLRPLRSEDAGRLVLLINNIAVARWLTRVPHPYSATDAETFLTRVAAGNDPHFAITLSDRLIGVISLANHLGYWLGQPYWGRGYASEAARAVVGWHFARGGEALRSGYLAGNAGSKRILEQLGFAPAGVEKVVPLSTGQATDHHLMQLLRAEWGTVA